MELIVEECNAKHIINVNNANKMGKHFAAFLDDDVEAVTIKKKSKDKEPATRRRLEKELKTSMKYWNNEDIRMLIANAGYRSWKDGFKIGIVTGVITTGFVAAILIALL